MVNNTESKERHRIWTLSELYYPEETSTGYYMTKITETLTSKFNTFAICSQPTYLSRGIKAPRNEIHNGVNILRVPSTTFNRNNTFLKFINMLTFSISTLIIGILKIRKNDIIFVVTNPPSLPFIAMIICKIKGANYVLRIDDVYPEILVVAKKLNKDSFINFIFNYLNRVLYINALSIIVLGRDMKDLVIKKENSTKEKIKIITNWGETDNIVPNSTLGDKFREELGLKNKFVLLWAGNMGIPHGIEDIFHAAKKLKMIKEIHFLFIGHGIKKDWLVSQVETNNMKNFTFLNPMPRSDQEKFLNGCDVVLSSLIPGMEGVSVPSRIYNVFSAGKPILGIGDRNTELAHVINEYNLGWNALPNDVKSVVKIIKKAASEKGKLIEMGTRARMISIKIFSQNYILKVYLNYFIYLIKNRDLT